MSRQEDLHIDSFNLTYSSSNTYQTYPLSTTSISTAPNAYNAEIPLQTTKSGVKRIYLKSLELPIGFPSIRANSNLHILTISNTSNFATTYPITLADKNYTNISVLLADINTQFLSTYPTLGITLTLSSNGNVQIASTNSTIFTGSIYVVPSNLAYLLGFRSGLDTNTVRNIVAGAVYMVSIDNYILMYLPQFSSIASTTSGVYCSFKIPLSATNGVVYFKADSNMPFINVQSNLHFNKIQVCFYDSRGFSLNSYGLHWSATLSLVY